MHKHGNPVTEHISLSRIALLQLVVTLLLLCGCHHQLPPLMVVNNDALPLFTDDGDRLSLLSCARSHRIYLAGLPAKYQTTIAGTTYPLSWLLLSMDEFISLLENTTNQLEINNRLKEGFTVFQAAGRPKAHTNEMLVTGYYEPLFPGSLERNEPYVHPLYSVPQSLISRVDRNTGKKTVGRVNSDGTFTAYWTRAEIDDFQYLAGEELVYLKDPFDAFLLHVQGSGRIALPDGSQRAVRFAGHNGHSYNSIGKLLVDEGKLSRQEASIPAIRGYFKDHPDEQQRILHHNPRFIFFSWGNDVPPCGSLGRPLTPGRSIAIDRDTLPDSLFAWLETTRPVVDGNGELLKWRPTSRFVLPQDSGAAIKGPGRVDLFWGNGMYAETAASNMKEKGRLYFFIKKGYTGK